ncbi:MAG: VIT and VWA domain-containing protein [Synergistota bacterium]|nr:VIT and VWA domain-containing protein [Synergistota bacterium]
MAVLSEETGMQFAVRNSETGEDVKLAMEQLWLTGRVLPVGARLVLRHVFKSAEKKPLELVYTYGLPRDATLRSFRVVGEGFTVESELKPTDKAREDYEEAIQSGHLAVLNRVYHDGLSSLTVGNVRPGETVAVYLEILAGVEHHDDGFRFRFPFTLAPSYHRDARVAVTPEGHGEMELPEDRYDDLLLPPWSPDARNLHTVGFDLLVEFPGSGEVASPSHMLAVKMGEDASSHVRLANMEDVPNRNLVLDVKTETAAPKTFAGLDKNGQVQFITLVPSTAFGEKPDTPVRAVFVVDRSGSMSGAPLEQADKAICACLGALRPEDQFGIVAFGSSAHALAPHLLPGTIENREKAAAFLSRAGGLGGTELLGGLTAAMEVFGEASGDIFLLTDGQVFAGSEIMAGMRDRGFRVHCLGIGSASQDRFLALLARETGGVSRFMTPRERVDMAALELFASVGRPVANEVTCSVTGSSGGKVGPMPADMVFAGTPLVVYGSCAAEGNATLHLAFEGASGPGELDCPLTISSEELGETVRLVRGARLITDLESQFSQATVEGNARAKRSASRIEQMLKKASEEYGLSSQVMSLVAVVKREGDVEGEVPETRVIPVGMPQDTAFGSYFESRIARRGMVCGTVECPPAPFREESLLSTVHRTSRSRQPLNSPADAQESGRHRRRSKASEANAVQKYYPSDSASLHDATEIADRLVDLAARLEPDGGMPGDDPEERILASLLALLAFHAEGHTPDRGPFAPHMKRLLAYLKQADLSILSEDHRDIVSRVLDAIEGRGPVPKIESRVAADFVLRRGISSGQAWRLVIQELERRDVETL